MSEADTDLDHEKDVMLDSDDDVIVIKKTWLVTALVGLLAFAIGGGLGFFLFGQAYYAGQESVQVAEVQAPQQVQAPQPTQPPPRIEGVSADDDPAIGPDDAPVVIVEFSDFQCPYCARFRQQTLDALLEQYDQQVRFVYRDFPLSSIHPEAQKAAEASQCANDQGQYWEMHDAMFLNQAVTGLSNSSLITMAQDLDLDVADFTECLESGKYADEVAADYQDGLEYGVSGTPTFFINGVRLVGAQPLPAFTQVIDQELESN